MPFSTYSAKNANPQIQQFAAIGAFTAALCCATPAAAQTQDMLELMGRCAPGIHPITLSAVVRHESSGNPYAIGVNGGARLARQPRTREEAISTARMLQRQGVNFDSGLGQVNVRNIGWLGVSIAELFDPCVNLRSAATVLSDCYGRATKARLAGQAAVHAALSCYNTGSLTKGFSNGYVAKVAAKAGAAPSWSPPKAAPIAASETAPQVGPSPGRSADAFGSQQPDAFRVGMK